MMKRISLLLVLSAFGLISCASHGPVRTVIVKEYAFAVAMETGPESGPAAPPAQAKPATIVPSDIKTLMGGLRYREKAGLLGNSESAPVFQESEIDRLTPVLAEALAKAGTRQRIRFISFNQEQSALLSNSRKTEGVIFAAPDGRLHVAFNYINARRLPSESSALYSRYAEVDPLRIDSSETPLSPVAAYAEMATLATGKPAPMWVVADLEKLRAAGGMTIPDAAGAERIPAADSRQTPLLATPLENRAPADIPEDRLRQGIKSKLRYLKELLDEGLISESDYNAKKMELLRKID